MIALDTNILARFYVDDPADPQAAQQRPIARRLLTQDRPVFVPLTVVLELESVLRAFYGFAADDFVRVVQHLLGLANVTVEEWARVSDALALHKDGLDFADALHLLASSGCTEFMSFDDRRFARRAKRLGLTPAVVVPVG
ncbi:MAG: type II toxin-antitoxin system VapC family toxin [Gammaproteobacteria bacterium]|uniref:type II toxin-antitoxin system VapC family toxin n=1 Tax=Rhodoferax sp. TaxID=50421 RepID=UPI0017AC8C2C|nr:type II toxin-antitoxin system VapC family toxin [Rhodoferax sp.]MBU3900016.1 type II toxin-antitoxin system VapC family toxin [Gammaproteobacteria bacterium]MBA3059333.1 type II toxin-antitoxin system VapC family toxin [Rhodoferax sp.]MBU3999380.1 type II toxin-antitoxin system VapC family toxin [Gammaproteobacteria bacterium]MBU4082054.1 type II toxin-antitoxin system VapC family toxin [Gammaproteobacteria bacterium]MBU4115365.1 type II toxin-antitoxin system VapC family toxin [Gammaprote